MKQDLYRLAVGAALCLAATSHAVGDSPITKDNVVPPSNNPNILMVLIDDLGYTDLGLYGGNIKTPNIDALGKEGVVFGNAHVNPSCAPTRASFMTGKDPHRVGLGSQNGVAPPGIPVTTPGYKGSLEGEYVGLPAVLKERGYDTYQVGKWHLGYEPGQSPGSLGFDEYFALLDGAASHYADRLGVALSISPTGTATYIENGAEVQSLPDDFYSTEYYTDWLLGSLDKRSKNGKPFFAYLAYTAVHDPLHAPKDLIEKYVDVFADGFESVKRERTIGLARQGLIQDAETVSRWLAGTPAWNSLSAMQQTDMVRRMAVHAAMLEYLDSQLGRIVDYLKSTGDYDNTLIVVMSDNGAATVPKTFYARDDKGLKWQNESYPRQSVEDYGAKESFPTLGTFNAQAVSGPYFGFKANLHEGGTRVPMIVKVPGSEEQFVDNHFAHISDLYATFADYAGAELDDQRGLLGCSLKPQLSGLPVRICRDGFGMGYMGWRAYWEGAWKLVFVSKSFGGTGEYALYNLAADPGEVYDLAKEFPEKLQRMSEKWVLFAAANGITVVPMESVNDVFDRVADAFFEIYWGD